MAQKAQKRAVLVTGGAKGIGRATAALLAARGYRVAVADVGVPPGAGKPFFFHRTDVSSEPAVRDCVRAVVKRFGRLDALVNNAGIADPANGPLEKLSLAEWNRRIGTNLTGAFLMAKHCAPHLRGAGGGLVNN
jgi:NAD(P)-dependent dehydrogenase (short-subunit alcohol dehydrogenase family)